MAKEGGGVNAASVSLRSFRFERTLMHVVFLRMAQICCVVAKPADRQEN